jgi:TfoX/Sxy family transcriptional regulator of competence genes
MAYDIKLAELMRTELQGLPFVEKKMFGGIGFLLHGNMACGLYKDDMVVRINPAMHEARLKKKHTKPFALRGSPMKGWLLVEPAGCRTKKQITAWISEGVEFALSLPPKQK